LLKIKGKVELNEGAAWMAGKENLPTESKSLRPKIAFTVVPLTSFWIFKMFR
jgi:hypothetical protein